MKNTVFILLIVALFYSCSNDDDAMMIPPQTSDDTDISAAITKIPKDINKLFEAKGNPNAKRVIIYEEGGPSDEFDTETFEPVTDGDDPGFSQLFKDDYRVYVHQALTLNTQLCSRKKLTKKESDIENKVTVEILDRVIKHFKSQGKTVYVIGHSFGGFILTKYIAEKGNRSADKFLIMASRLDMQLVVAENYSNCKPYIFKDGITPVPATDSELLNELKRCPTIASMAGAMVTERFTKTVRARNLSNVVYVYANDDEQTGGLLQNEKNFLKSKRVKVVEIPKGGHSSMFFSPHPKRIYDELIK